MSKVNFSIQIQYKCIKEGRLYNYIPINHSWRAI